jgi:exosortase K
VIRERRWAIAGVALALVVIVVGKTYYRDATAGELTWILAPTAKLVSWISGGHFVYEAGPGWVDPQIGFIIAAPCAGVNFALAAFLALGVGAAPGMVSLRTLAARLAAAAAVAYVATLVVNTARIAIAIAMHRGTIDIAGDRAELHRIEGIVIYLGGLVALYALARSLDGRKAAHVEAR